MWGNRSASFRSPRTAPTCFLIRRIIAPTVPMPGCCRCAATEIPKPFVSSTAVEGSAKFSPDGKWVAYCSTESGRVEVYIQPGPGPKIQISSEGGTDPVWRRDGKELFIALGTG